VYIYQIEVSNICSLKCTYCPHPEQQRTKGMMSLEVFQKCVELFGICQNKATLRLHNFGEVLLHPQLPVFIKYADERGVKCSFFTNGLTMKKTPFSREFWRNLADHGLETIDFSSHELKLEEFQEIVDGVVKIGRVYDPHTRVLGTWAGQTGPPEIPVPEPCIFERMNAMVVLWDGRISSCCLDVEGQAKGLHIDDLLRDKSYKFIPIRLCNTCSSMRHQENL
jgi:Radical SAM superfamily